SLPGYALQQPLDERSPRPSPIADRYFRSSTFSQTAPAELTLNSASRTTALGTSASVVHASPPCSSSSPESLLAVVAVAPLCSSPPDVPCSSPWLSSPCSSSPCSSSSWPPSGAVALWHSSRAAA